MREPTCMACGCRTLAETVKTSAIGEATVFRTRSVHRGTGGGMYEQIDNLNWGPTCDQSLGRTKTIRRPKAASGSDEAIVSEDPAGHDNPQASQGPLDRIARGSLPLYMPFGATGRWRTWLSWRISRGSRRRSSWNSCLKPYWGKPAVRNFRGGGGNGMPSRRLLISRLKMSTLKSNLHITAPPLYSTVKQCLVPRDSAFHLARHARFSLLRKRRPPTHRARRSNPGKL
jgi:hypothetical protein